MGDDWKQAVVARGVVDETTCVTEISVVENVVMELSFLLGESKILDFSADVVSWSGGLQAKQV